MVFYIVVGDAFFLGTWTICTIGLRNLFSRAFKLGSTWIGLKYMAYYVFTVAILLMLISDFIELYYMSVGVKEMVFFPTPLYEINTMSNKYIHESRLELS